jgi:hypothetical protein
VRYCICCCCCIYPLPAPPKFYTCSEHKTRL